MATTDDEEDLTRKLVPKQTSEATAAVLLDFKRRPSQVPQIAEYVKPIYHQSSDSSSVSIRERPFGWQRRHSYMMTAHCGCPTLKSKKSNVSRHTSQASVATTSLGELSLDILKYSRVKGFRQLQKVETLVASNEKRSTSEDYDYTGEKVVDESPFGLQKVAAARGRHKLSMVQRIPTLYDSDAQSLEAHIDEADNEPANELPDQAKLDKDIDDVPSCNAELTTTTDVGNLQHCNFSLHLQAQKVNGDVESGSLDQLDQMETYRTGSRIRIGSSGASIGYRLGKRKALYKRRRMAADYSMAVAAIGIVIAIFETEMTVDGVYSKNSWYSFCMKSMVSISTFLLLCLLGLYHAIEIQLFSIDNCVGDWRVAMDGKRISKLLLELLLCSVHTFPTPEGASWAYLTRTIVHTNGKITTKLIPIDNILVIPMFLRLYLCFRVLLLHSKLFTDASSRSIGALNRIKFNIRFVLKTLMTICPGTVLVVLILSLLIVASWTIRICEGAHDSEYGNLVNCLWFIAITFLSIGYGDIVPISFCGRIIGITTGVLGSGCTALVVAVVARKLELTRAEKHVHNFMLDTQLTKQLKHAAANVLRETWLIYKYTKLCKRIRPTKIRLHQRNFLSAIQQLRNVKIAQRKLMENSTRLADLPKLHHQLHDMVAETRNDQIMISERLSDIDSRLHSLELDIRRLPEILCETVINQIGQLNLIGDPSAISRTTVEAMRELGKLSKAPENLSLDA